jgi:mono/diheme cytochrome c family protein
MRHVAVRRVTGFLGAAFVLCAVAFVWLVRDERSAPAAAVRPSADGSLLFERHCAACHGVGDLRGRLRDPQAMERTALEAFLRDHGDATDEEDRLIVDFLAGVEAPGQNR